MKLAQNYTYTPASNPALKWLTDPGPSVPAPIRLLLLGELFNSPKAVMAAIVNGLIVNGYALYLTRSVIFLVFMILEVAIAVVRFIVARRVAYTAARGLPVPTDLNLLTALSWCALQGAMTFATMRSGIHALQILSSVSAVGYMAPVCARNYAAPRWTLLLVCSIDLPLAIGAALTGESWGLIMFLQAPLYLYGCLILIKRFQTLAVANLLARLESRYNAIHDPLTKTLNRAGLMEILSEKNDVAATNYILFYLDLDGFKRINDTFGHCGGDQLLREVADRLHSCVTPTDIVARLGGDEFVVLAIGMAPSEGATLAESLIRRVADQPYSPGSNATVGMSIGFACYPEDAVSSEVLQHMADTALYESKNAGKGVQRRFSHHMSATRTSDAKIADLCVRADALIR